MEKIVIEKNNSGLRIDKFLSSLAKASADNEKEFFVNGEVTRGEIIRNIKSGNILINDKIVKPSSFLREGDIVGIDIPEKTRSINPNKNVKFEIIYQNENFVIINKPAGVLVHPGHKNENDTLANGLLYKFPEIGNVGDDPSVRPGIVHRLDRDTSGVMVVARNQEVFLELKKKFSGREVQKTYWAVVIGAFEKQSKSGIIDRPLAKTINYKKQIVAGKKTKTKIRSAVTKYRFLKSLGKYSLVEAMPKTGRTHQIRVHLSFIGHPILGDRLYKSKIIKVDENLLLPKRQLLHAKKVEFSLFGKEYSFEAPLPEDFSRFLD